MALSESRTSEGGRTILVAAAVVQSDGRYLVGLRPPGKRHAGLWEFPGGKVGEGETLDQAIARELAEEMALHVESTGAELFEIRDPGSPFLIRFIEVNATGTPQAIEHREVGWFSVMELRALPMAPADASFVRTLYFDRRGADEVRE